MINPDASRVVVLEVGPDLESGKGIIQTGESMAESFNLPESVSYCGWFAVLHPGRNDVISSFVLQPTPEGIEKLRTNGLPERFPALIHGNDGLYFMAGDFGKCNVSLLFSRIVGLREVIALVRSKGTGNPNNFFYSYYQPFVSSLVESAGEHTE